MNLRFSILLVCLFLLSCKRDPPVPLPEDGDCLNLYYSSSVVNANWPGVDTVYNTPRFNPANPNEIVYVQGIVSTNKSYLVKRNLSTGQETRIVADVWQMPDWNIMDWIVFNHADNQVWKIKSNGDSLTLVTTNMRGGFYAIWSHDGSKIAYIPNGRNYYTLVCNARGDSLYALPFFLSYLTRWSPDSLFICGLPTGNDFVNVVYQNASTGQEYHPTNNVLDANSSNMVYSNAVDWTSDSKFLMWANPHGIFKTDILTGKTTKINAACNRKYYTSISVSSDGTKIILQRYDQKLENNYLYIKAGISLMDIDGKNETIIK